MPINYEELRSDNEKRYGTDIGRVGHMLLSERYDNKNHFIFELLQNAEDALRRRKNWTRSRSVVFRLDEDSLHVTHFGQPFDDGDVRGVCGIGESTKELTAIGRFGIGFKSVYAIAERPEIHSGDEDFAIEHFVFPVGVAPISRDPDQTVIVLPLKASIAANWGAIFDGLQRLSSRALLFLREIDEIAWFAGERGSGAWLREDQELDPGVRKVTVVGQEKGRTATSESWLVFSKAVYDDHARDVGHVELAFSLTTEERTGRQSTQPVSRSPLVVFFPTVVETHLGFLVQGPYRTTPSRDNVPSDNDWNQHLVHETSALLVEALQWLRKNGQVDVDLLRCLPLDRGKFSEDTMFHRLFKVTQKTLLDEPYIPCLDVGYTSAKRARLGRGQELRDLFTAEHLRALLGEEVRWVTGEITADRAPELRRYLIGELGVPEIGPEFILTKIDRGFMETQSDAWVLKLYEFLSDLQAVRRQALERPLVRLEDGTHTIPFVGGRPMAFLPGGTSTGFPTVRSAVCATSDARKFLELLGLSEADPVDDVIRNVLPRYEVQQELSDAEYISDMRRVHSAFQTDSKAKRDKLIQAVGGAAIVKARDAGTHAELLARPVELYLPTETLSPLFGGLSGILLVTEKLRVLNMDELEAFGVMGCLRPMPVPSGLDDRERAELRRAAGYADLSRESEPKDYTLFGIERVISSLGTLDVADRVRKSQLLWDALRETVEKLGSAVVRGTYEWHYYYRRTTSFDASFIRLLNESPWVSDDSGNLHRPETVDFASLGWTRDPILEERIRFKAPAVQQLARAVGIEIAALDLLKELGVTSEAELRKLLGLRRDARPATPSGPLKANAPPEGDSVPLIGGSGFGPDDWQSPQPTSNSEYPDEGASRGLGQTEDARPLNADPKGQKYHESGPFGRSPGSPGARPFISYVGVHSEDEDTDPDGLANSQRMEIENSAIEVVLEQEPKLQRTAESNPGFDLVEHEGGTPTRYVEVKAMTGTLDDRPVGLSHTQFTWAQKFGESYWLYVVENVGVTVPNVVRIQDPAGKARTFTFDRGWRRIAHPPRPGAAADDESHG